MHFDENSEHESVRCSYLQANRIPVLSEWNLPTNSPHIKRPGIALGAYDDLATQARMLIDNPYVLDSLGNDGYEAIRRIPMVREVDRAL